MTDFAKKIKQKRDSIESQRLAKEQAEQARKLEAESEFEENASVLKSYILPVIDSAEAEINANGLGFRRFENLEFDPITESSPSIYVACTTQPRKSDGYRATSRWSLIDVSQSKITIGYSLTQKTRMNEVISAEVDPESAKEIIEESLVEIAGEVMEIMNNPVYR